MRPVVGALMLGCVVVAGCGVEATPGEMSSRTFRSLDARDDLTPQEVRDAGGVDDESLARTFVDEGGSPEPSGATCLFARTTYRDSYRGTARFCFDGERVVSVERNRADLED